MTLSDDELAGAIATATATLRDEATIKRLRAALDAAGIKASRTAVYRVLAICIERGALVRAGRQGRRGEVIYQACEERP